MMFRSMREILIGRFLISPDISVPVKLQTLKVDRALVMITFVVIIGNVKS